MNPPGRPKAGIKLRLPYNKKATKIFWCRVMGFVSDQFKCSDYDECEEAEKGCKGPVDDNRSGTLAEAIKRQGDEDEKDTGQNGGDFSRSYCGFPRRGRADLHD